MADILSAWSASLDALLAQWGVAGLALSAFISSTLMPGGSEALLALLVAKATDHVWLLVAAATAGNTAGAMTSWWIGRCIPNRKVPDRAVALMQRWGAPLLVLSWLPIVGDVLPVAAGWLHVGWVRSLAWIALGKAARYAALAWGTAALVG